MYLAGLSAPAVARLLLFPHQQSLRDDAMQMVQTHHQLLTLQLSLHFFHQPPRLQHRGSAEWRFPSNRVSAHKQSTLVNNPKRVPQTYSRARDLNHPLPVADMRIRLQLVGPIKQNARPRVRHRSKNLGQRSALKDTPEGIYALEKVACIVGILSISLALL
ncbi:hypothetical protein CONLIGDRAFT_638540, partial [Coniochaeta ligniaria NRRL 30616]